MDRLSFINQDFLNKTSTSNKCQLDGCECEITLSNEKKETKKTSSFHLVTISIMALVCAIILTIIKIEVAKANIMELTFVKNEKVVSCAPGYSNKKNLNNNHGPTDGNHQNNCSHQQGNLCGSRRRFTC